MRKKSLTPFKKQSRTFDLSATSIDRASEWLVDNLGNAGAEKSDCLRMRLFFEEALLNMAEHYGETQEFEAYIEQRLGRYRLRVVVNGERYNPLRAEKAEGRGSWSTSLFSVIDVRAHYAYSPGINVLRLSLHRTPMNPVFKIVLALLIGLLFGLLGELLLPDAVEDAFNDMFLNPIANTWIRLLQAIAGPIIFFTSLTATFDTKRIADFGGSRLFTITRYFAFSAIVTIIALICAWQFFPLVVTGAAADGEVISSLFDDVLQIVPGNLVEPFSTANTPQLLLIAVAMGYLLASMEDSVGDLNKLIRQLNSLGLTMANVVCALAPFFVGLLLCLRIWSHDVTLLVDLWLPLVVSIGLSAAFLLVVILTSSARMKMSPLLLARKLKTPFIEALKRGSLDFTALDDLASSCKRSLGIDGEFARAVLPQGLFLYMPTSAVGICVFLMFAAHSQEMAVPQVWFLAVAAISVVLAVATPPITGANLLSFVAAFTYLGIPTSVFLDVMVFDLVFSVFSIAFDQALLQVEMIEQARHMGFLDEEALHAPLVAEG